MSLAADINFARVDGLPPARLLAERIRIALLLLTAAAGAFVFVEPSPYEAVSLLTMLVFVFTGLSLSAPLIPLVVLLSLYNLGFAVAVTQIAAQTKPMIWVLVSVYLSVTALFFAAVLGTDTERRLDFICRGCILAGVIAALAGVLGYFHLLGGTLSEFFTRFGRARGTFNDPNVLGAFLIFPSLLVLQRMLAGSLAQVLKNAILLGLFVLALLVTFSRAAWGQFALTSLAVMFFTLVTTNSSRQRLRILIMAALGTTLLMLLIAAILSTESVATLFKERASLEQDYDLGHLGRFGRYSLGAALALDHPLGIGPLQFATIFREDPHNTFLNTFMSGGWLTGIAYLTISLATVTFGFRFLFVPTPWRQTYIAVYAAFFGVTCESFIIDIDHWRHYFLLLGVMWGLMAAAARYRAAASRSYQQWSPAHA
jgi:hypothetical protein